MENLKEFVPVIGYEGYYEVNRIGQVKSLARFVKNGNRYIFRKERILKSIMGNCGYYVVVLCKNSIKKPHTIHRIIAITFIPNPENKPQVNHINGIKSDNSINNLEWCTSSENSKHAHDTGLQVSTSRIEVYCSVTNKRWESITECSLDTGIPKMTLSRYLSGKRQNKTSIKLTEKDC